MCRFHSSVFFLMLWLTGWLGAVEITAGPTIDVQGTAASVSWSTDIECGTLFKYGLDADHLNHSATGAVGTQHAVNLSGLIDGKTYFYSAGTAKKSIKTGQFGVGKVIVTPAVIPVPPMLPSNPKTTPAPVVRPAPEKKAAAPATAYTPAARQTWGDYASLQDHFNRHGRDFKSTSAEHYAHQAWEFLQRAITEGLPAKVDEDGVIRVYEARSKSFASYNKAGRTKTYFKPQRPDYFRDQPGKIVRLQPPTKR